MIPLVLLRIAYHNAMGELITNPVGIPIADLNTMVGLNKEQTNGS